MIRKCLCLAALIATAAMLLSSASCARSQKLVGITVTPQGSSITLSEIGQLVGTQFTALGTYIHPPETRDLTKTAIWSTDAPQIITLSPTTPGLFITTGTGCGTNIGVTATVYTDNGNPSGNVVIGTATMSVSIGTSGSCP
jgi:hypothetical protein